MLVFFFFFSRTRRPNRLPSVLIFFNRQASLAMASKSESYDAGSLPDLLPVYYKRLFPYGPYFRWLSYGGGKVDDSFLPRCAVGECRINAHLSNAHWTNAVPRHLLTKAYHNISYVTTHARTHTCARARVHTHTHTQSQFNNSLTRVDIMETCHTQTILITYVWKNSHTDTDSDTHVHTSTTTSTNTNSSKKCRVLFLRSFSYNVL